MLSLIHIYIDIDVNGDGNPDINIDTDGDGNPDDNLTNQDTNGDGKCDLNCCLLYTS